jgi:hypothetical protein
MKKINKEKICLLGPPVAFGSLFIATIICILIGYLASSSWYFSLDYVLLFVLIIFSVPLLSMLIPTIINAVFYFKNTKTRETSAVLRVNKIFKISNSIGIVIYNICFLFWVYYLVIMSSARTQFIAYVLLFPFIIIDVFYIWATISFSMETKQIFQKT